MSELQQLRDRVAELEETLGLTASLPPALLAPPKTGRLKRATPLLQLLLARSFVPHRAAYLAVYGDRLECDQPSPKNIDILIFYIRRALRPHDIEIANDVGRGWYLNANNKAKLRALIDTMNAERA